MDRWLDSSTAPIWVQEFPRVYSYDELSEAFDHLDDCVGDLVKRGERASLLVDISRTRVGDARVRQRVSKTFMRTQRMAGDAVVGQAFVVANRVQRGALTAVLWLFSPAWPLRVFTSRSDAMAWLRELHDADGARSDGREGVKRD